MTCDFTMVDNNLSSHCLQLGLEVLDGGNLAGHG
eukprot:CAMPEP_0113659446 /NCGR_PEP_ID=MMETSP0017_2-20120614/32359_1 /TAXON_ID=2856 /ORGANISM="Cylindrotheca closterium" /LENGTH=33 /DNA_ID=CAMNT_0000573991 /DNA_START=202 /DNA_END=300 /DNA_ORIENTATION=+ /assembly_acc=CAM_ASM_000147